MPHVYLIPGLLESFLHAPSAVPGNSILWPNPARIVLGEVAGLALAPDGVSPLPPFGQACAAGGPIPLYVAPLAYQLRQSLGPLGWRVVEHGYDWRLLIETTGQQLADRIAAEVAPGDHAVLIGHSMGGLLACYAYGRLAQQAPPNRVSRVVTVATPSKGSYQPLLLAGDGDAMVQGVIRVHQGLLGFAAANGVYVPQPVLTDWDVVRVAATWPGLYELLPFVGPDQPGYDPDRPALYNAANWTALAGVQPQWLAHARDVWQPLIRSAPYRPPASVLYCVGGIGYQTADRLVRAGAFGLPGALGLTDLGDGTVALDSAQLPGRAALTVVGDHHSMMVHPALVAAVATLVTQASLPAPPPSPPPPAPVPPPPVLVPPPLTQSPSSGGIGTSLGSPVHHDC